MPAPRRWTDAENATLKRLMAEGKHPSEMMEQLPGRSANAIHSRWARMEDARYIELRGRGNFGRKDFAESADGQAALTSNQAVQTVVEGGNSQVADDEDSTASQDEGGNSQAADDEDTTASQAEGMDMEPQQEQNETSDASQTDDEMTAGQEPTEMMDYEPSEGLVRATVGSNSYQATDHEGTMQAETVNVRPVQNESTDDTQTEDKAVDDHMDYEPSVIPDQPPEEEHLQSPVTDNTQPEQVAATTPTEQDQDTAMALDTAVQSTHVDNDPLMAQLWQAANPRAESAVGESSPPAIPSSSGHAPTNQPLANPSVDAAGSMNQTPQEYVGQAYEPRTFPSLHTVVSGVLRPDTVSDELSPDSPQEEDSVPPQAAAVPENTISPPHGKASNPATQVPPQRHMFSDITQEDIERAVADPFPPIEYDPNMAADLGSLPDMFFEGLGAAVVPPLHMPDFPNLRKIPDLRATSITPVDQRINTPEYEHLSQYFKSRPDAPNGFDNDDLNRLERNVALSPLSELQNPAFWNVMGVVNFQNRFTGALLQEAYGELQRYRSGLQWHAREWSAMEDIMLIHSADSETVEQVANKLDRGPAAITARYTQVLAARAIKAEKEAYHRSQKRRF